MKNLPAARLHLKNDPIMAKIILSVGEFEYEAPTDRFANLVGTIVNQQLSGKAAATIYSRVVDLFPDTGLIPDVLLIADPELLRGAGLSYQKIKYIKDLATKVLNNTIQLNKLDEMEDEEVITHLTQVSGIGRWSAQMKLMFTLHRPDVFPIDDLGIQKAINKFYGIDMKDKSAMEKLALKWQPYRTVASWYLWRGLDDKIV